MGGSGRVDRVVAKLHEYLAVPAVVGFEEPFLRHLAADFAGLGRDVERGPGIVHVGGRDPEPVVTAHVDRHGLVARGGGLFGYAAHVVKAEEYGEQVAASRGFVATVCSRLADEQVVAYDAGTGEPLARGTTAHRCDRDTAVELAVSGMEAIPAGTPAGFALGCVEAGDLVIGQLDNTLSAAVAYVLCADGFGGQLVFTAREEAGWSARHFLAYAAPRMPPSRRLVVLDTSPFPEPDRVHEGVVVLRRSDAGGEFAAELVQRLEADAGASASPTCSRTATSRPATASWPRPAAGR